MDEQTGRAGYITRLEAFVDLMKRRKRRKENASTEEKDAEAEEIKVETVQI
jgi:predicted nucleotide-binding protein (sugar kinase/HSP70/actin superfamily)